ncbi:MAG: DUF952 domain-containing protein [Brevundimonas sp.]|uniref:DUF952 domain-containing protein n=1 Tax=Brevundimonas sp. TaxID=1871086 RepID=UPI00275D4220|nr:DUF952 domain-containing protein [Brevundimonas sp.]MDP3401119.1 DUF952 domain-containing protein [Brevundimonas sp.]MDZ4113967.1 DUF952 domain-containing protein [Brevundimonas sp.]
MTGPEVIYKLVDAEDWQVATVDGAYPGSAVDVRDGYIHMSTADQLDETARRHFSGLPDLLKVTIDTAALAELPDEALRWEPSRGGAMFPHLYAPLPLSAVRSVEACHVDEEGRLVMETDA